MRIAVATWSGRRVGGVEDYLAAIVPALIQAGHDVAFWQESDQPPDRDPISLPDEVPVICAAECGTIAALAELRSWGPDLIYVHGLRDDLAERELLGIAPSVFFLHTYYGTCISGGKTFTRPIVTPCSRVFGWPCLLHYLPHGCGGWSPLTMARAYRRQSDRLAVLRRYDAVITHSDHMCGELAQHGIAPRGVGFPVRATGPRIPHPTLPGTWRLLFAGRMGRLKGGQVLLRALSRVKAGLDRTLRVTVAGDGPERARWEHLAAGIARATAGIEIDFVGWVDPDRLNVLMAEADLLVVPSLWPEPFGAVGPMAGTQGLPAAAFDVGGISQWLVDGKNGALAPGHPPTADGLADAILRCLSGAQAYEKLREGAIEIAGRFRMDIHLAAVLDVFEEVVTRRTAGSQPSAGR
jgi:glycosyltransferase involved in cell wall biosynthesis